MNEEEKNVLMDHSYDGIQEFDFSLPRWWLATFWLGIIFGFAYIIYFMFMNGPSLSHEYYADWDKVRATQKVYMKQLKAFDAEKFAHFRKDENMLLYGSTVFQNNCQACHNKNAAGDIGPNLTDNSWIFIEGGDDELFKFIISGSPTTGMPAWGPLLSKEDLYAVAAYIKSMNGFEHTNPPAKEAEGEEYPAQ